MNNTWNELDAMFDPLPPAQPITPQPVRVVPFPDVRQNVRPNNEQHIGSTPFAQESAHPAQYPHSEPHSTRTYTAVELAEQFDVSDVTIRTRWYPHVLRVAPDWADAEKLLRDDKAYTQLAADLFADFYQEVKEKNARVEHWITDARSRFADRWIEEDDDNAEVLLAQVVPDEVKGTLVLANQVSLELNRQGEERKERLMELIRQTKSAEATLSENQLEIAKQRGQNAAFAEFEVELTAKIATLNQLRQNLGL